MLKHYSDSQHNWLWSLYLLNLLLLPVLAAAIAMMLLWRYGLNANGKRVLYAFMLCFFLLVVVPSLAWFSLAHGALFWVFFITYWVTAHASCILLGVLGLVRRFH